MADFSDCYPFVLANEDWTPPRYEPNPDPVKVQPTDSPEVAAAKRSAQALSGINSYFWPLDFAFIASLPQDQRATAVQAFYFKNYWNQWYAQLSSNDIAKRVFDTAVNIGSEKAVKILQMAVNDQRGDIWLETDGVWGPLTITEVNDCDPTDLVPVFQQTRVAHYKANDANSPYFAQLIARAEK
jgi:hypothetical protein